MADGEAAPAEGAAPAAGVVSEGDAKAIRDLARTLRDKRSDADLLSQEFTCSECNHSNPWKVHLSCDAAELDPVRHAWIEDEPGAPRAHVTRAPP